MIHFDIATPGTDKVYTACGQLSVQSGVIMWAAVTCKACLMVRSKIGGEKSENEEMFYIQNTDGYHGNALIWWGIKSAGYTSDLNKAGKFTRDEAEDICMRRNNEKAWPCSYIDNNEQARKTIIDSQYLDHEFSKDWKSI